jgi:hypothetical protein
LLVGCAKGSKDAPLTISYFGYEKYDFINNIYVPDSKFVMSDGGSYFTASKINCSDKVYKINVKTIDQTTQNIHYQLSSLEINPTFNSCFTDSADFTLTYINQDADRIYYNSSLFGDTYNLFKKKN